MTVTERVKEVQEKVFEAAAKAGRNPEDIRILAATKTNPPEKIQEAIAAGITLVGENRVQEMVEKYRLGAYEGAELHFIGVLQKNKVKNVIGISKLIHSVDSIGLAEEISKRASAAGIIQPVLLEVNIGGEESKSGFLPEAAAEAADRIGAMGGISVGGLMAIPPVSVGSGGNRNYFAAMYKLFVDIRAKKYDNVSMDFLSMGMSMDYTDAILEGSNMIRLGSCIFGARKYT